MYSDRLIAAAKPKPGVDFDSRLFQQIAENQEDRRMYEHATQQLYADMPDSNPAKRHNMLKATINGKSPQPWMSMTRKASRSQQAQEEDAKDGKEPQSRVQLPPQQQQADASSSSDTVETAHPAPPVSVTVPHLPMYSEGLFGRERAHSIDPSVKVALTKPAVLQHAHSQPDQAPAQQCFDALDRFNARRGVQRPSRVPPALQAQRPPARQAQQAQQVQQPAHPSKQFDALDRFNARKAQQLPALRHFSRKGQHEQLRDHRHVTGQAAMNSNTRLEADGSEQSQTTAHKQELLPSARPSAQAAATQQAPRRLPDALDRFNAARRAAQNLQAVQPSAAAPAHASGGRHQIAPVGDTVQPSPVVEQSEASSGRMHSDRMIQGKAKPIMAFDQSRLERGPCDTHASIQARLAVGAGTRAVLADAQATGHRDNLAHGKLRSDAMVQPLGHGRGSLLGAKLQYVSADAAEGKTRKRMYSDAEADRTGSDLLSKRSRLEQAQNLEGSSIGHTDAPQSVFGRLG